MHKWNTEWQKNTSCLHTFIPSPGPSLPGMTLPRPFWVKLNRLCSGAGLFHSTMHKWGFVPLANCRCGTEEQTADHILASCPLYHPPNGTLSLVALDDDTVNWLETTALSIRWYIIGPKEDEDSCYKFSFECNATAIFTALF